VGLAQSDRSKAATAVLWRRRLAVAGASLAVAIGSGCAQGAAEITAGSTTSLADRCERPPVTGTGDAMSYPATPDELVDESDAVIEGSIIGEAGPAAEGRQPMTVSVETAYRGAISGNLVVQRLQTTYGITGTPGTLVGSWNGEPWYCAGERYMLFLQRLPDGSFLAISRLGAIPIQPQLDERTLGTWSAPDPFQSLATLDLDTLRSQVQASASRSTASEATLAVP